MKLKFPGRRSDNLRDQRGGGGASAGGGGGSLPIGKAGLPVALIGIVIALIFGGRAALDGGGGDSGFNWNNPLEAFPGEAAAGEPIPPEADPDSDLVDFVSVVLDDLQVFWADTFQAAGNQYQDATLTLFEGSVNTGCGRATSQVGPFYCPPDMGVYIDLDFFRELGSRFDAPGDFAQAYVIAHEIGHHVQNLLGINTEVTRLQQQNPGEANELSVRLELQADCFAGVWGHSVFSRDLLDSGDLQEGLDAAAAVGDDRIQAQAGVGVNPETWTHGSSEQRMEWFNRGFESGDPSRCDTFSGGY